MNLHLQAQQRDTLTAILTLAGLAVVVLVMAGFRLQSPSIHTVASGARLLLSVVAGLVVLGGGMAVVGLDVFHGRVAGIIAGVVIILLGLTLVGVTVGIPAPLQPIILLLQALVNILNGIVGFLGGFK